ncbi:purine operon repressor, PurR [Clostridium amylolyticum]|uniref:Purine operon repressor, PurR n=1 Tax=Clostridium amylolyticum TaxID=1121298 RepID=A0A1M6LJB7_9CLOT|nr:pur operon repressor [Clostridium amylolyticum]SHJ71260.1 purine operon repressor, PurR [Clostridium amylolyticum]
MEKLSRNSRISAITRILAENPNKVMSLNYFSELLNGAKSTISEDIVIVRDIMEKLNFGKVETIAGASGGVKYIPDISYEDKKIFAENLCELLMDKSRVVPGNFIYMTDIMFNPRIVSTAGIILASNFYDIDIDCVVTVETKGVPLAYEVAKNLGVQLVTVRRENKVTEGPTVSINYVSGSSGRIQNMSLARRSLKKGSKCIFIDDFMRAGGTAKGIKDLLNEFESQLVGIGVLVDNVASARKLVDERVSIIEFNSVDEEGNINMSLSSLYK